MKLKSALIIDELLRYSGYIVNIRGANLDGEIRLWKTLITRIAKSVNKGIHLETLISKPLLVKTIDGFLYIIVGPLWKLLEKNARKNQLKQLL